MYVYLDESGDTGNDIMNKDQKIMGLGGIITRTKVQGRIQDLHNEMLRKNGQTELKGKKWPKDRRRRNRIIEVAKVVEEEHGPIGVVACFVEKAYIVWTEVARDIASNGRLSGATLRWYNKRGRFDLIKAISESCEEEDAVKAWEAARGTETGYLDMGENEVNGMIETTLKGVLKGRDVDTGLVRCLEEAKKRKNTKTEKNQRRGTEEDITEDIRNGPDNACMSMIWPLIERATVSIGGNRNGIERIILDQSQGQEERSRLRMLKISQVNRLAESFGIPLSKRIAMSDEELTRMTRLGAGEMSWIERRVRFADSKEEVGLQWADLVISMMRRDIDKADLDEELEEVRKIMIKDGQAWVNLQSRQVSEQRSTNKERSKIDYYAWGEPQTREALREMI